MNYKELFENRFTKTHSGFTSNLLKKFYFNISPTTYVLKSMFSVVSSFSKGKKNLRILDLGCGGGMLDLTKYGEVYGVDISSASISNAKKIYKEALVSDITKKIPFPDEFFDIVFSSEVYGHIYLEDKNSFLMESYRVLKKGGLFVFSCETKGKNWLTKYLKNRDMYQEKWIDLQGHVGLETPTNTLNRFKRVFPNSELRVMNTYIFTIDELISIFPLLGQIISANLFRRFLNILLFPVYMFSIKFYKISSANDVLIYGKK